MDGRRLASRFPRGVLLVDKPAGRCWLYDWTDSGEFQVREPAGRPVQTDGEDSRFRAAAEGDYDVVAAPWAGEGQP